MTFEQRKYTVTIVMAGLCLFSQAVHAVLFEPGAGIGLQYTDNATLVNENKQDDLIATTYVGARLSEDEGAFAYDLTALFNNQNYTKDTYANQQYLNLGATADWEMIRERFNWFLRNNFTQRTVNTLGENTPDNIQNANAFAFGANITYPITARHRFTLIPVYSQYYYEVQRTDNKQYSVAANWNYNMYRLTTVGLNLNYRYIDYTEKNLLGLTINDTEFTTLVFTLDTSNLRSVYTSNLGATNVKRENGDEATGFVGFINWLRYLSARSRFNALISTDITDTSRAAVNLADGAPDDIQIPTPNDIQITTDVIRNSVFNLTYLREDAKLNSRIGARYREVNYSDSPLDRIIRGFFLRFTYQVTPLLASGAYANYNRSKQLDSDRLDERFTVGGNLRYNFSRRLNGLFDLQYRSKESTEVTQNYEEFSVFVSLVYGFGSAGKASSAGGF